MSIGKTQQMLAIERRHGAFLEDLIPPLLEQYGLVGAGNKLGVDQATLAYWCDHKLGIQRRLVALAPGDEVQVIRKRAWFRGGEPGAIAATPLAHSVKTAHQAARHGNDGDELPDAPGVKKLRIQPTAW